MAQSPALIATLKKQLKARSKTYADVAKVLDLSEASVKRMFAGQQFTLERLERVCQMIDLDFTELVLLMALEEPQLTQLTEQQEREIVDDFELLMVAISVINGYTYDDLIKQYKITPPECIQKLAKLDRLSVIELLPNNRIKLKVAPNFRWLTNGPIQNFFHQTVQQHFFQSKFDRDDELLLVSSAMLSKAHNAEIQKRMQKLAREFNELMQEDIAVPMGKKFGNTLVLAIRDWNFNAFQGRMRRDRFQES